MKKCPYCEVVKPKDLFYKNKNTKDGLCYECKECNNLRKYVRLRKKTRDDGRKGHIPTIESMRLAKKNLKYCSCCCEIKGISEYHKSKNQYLGIASICKICANEKGRGRLEKDKEKRKQKYLRNREKQRDSKLKRKYGISLHEYNEMLNNQNYKCAICGIKRSDVKKDFAVDHNHSTGQIRDLLCSKCNPAIGFVRENPEIARRLADYIERHGGTSSATGK